MLKSTHVPTVLPPLPPGWTEHKAPSGHSYYFHTETKQSTYKRPEIVIEPPRPAPLPVPAPIPQASFESQKPGNSQQNGQGQGQFRRKQPADRPKKKYVLPGAEPWLLIRTKLGRRFVYNPETNISLWAIPKDVMPHVVEFDRLRREGKSAEKPEAEATTISNEKPQAEPPAVQNAPAANQPEQAPPKDYDSDEYEEVEVTDDGDEDGDASEPKRPRVDAPPPGPLEFGEDDIAYQLAQLEGPGDYDDTAFTPYGTEDADGRFFKFRDMLDDWEINPYMPFDTVLETIDIIDDSRYAAPRNGRERRDFYARWSTDKIAEIKSSRANMESVDPRIKYFELLEDKASTKLYWVEFRRKFKGERSMKDSKLNDRDREKWYREFVTHLSKPESERKEDLLALLKEKRDELNAGTTVDNLPVSILVDPRYRAFRKQDVRADIVFKFTESLRVSIRDAERGITRKSGND